MTIGRSAWRMHDREQHLTSVRKCIKTQEINELLRKREERLAKLRIDAAKEKC